MQKCCFLLLALIVSINGQLAPRSDLQTGGVAQAQDNLLLNGSFESAVLSPWKGVSEANLTGLDAHHGNFSLKLSTEEVRQEGIDVIPGAWYTLTAWFKWNSYENKDWGYTHISIHNQEWGKISDITQLHERYSQHNWHKLAISFTPTTKKIHISFGPFGPGKDVELLFDDFRLFAKAKNDNPIIAPHSSTKRITVHSPVQFFANAEDQDGAISYISWDFGDGSFSTQADPTHTYLQRGQYIITVTVIDNDGGSIHHEMGITIVDSSSPLLVIDSLGDTTSTKAEEIEIFGKVFTAKGRKVSNLVWDNVNNDQAGVVTVAPGESSDWSTGKIVLKPGKNTILFTATDDLGEIGTKLIQIDREINHPEISNISLNTFELPVYEKLEIQFDLLTVADTPFFEYDTDPPVGVKAGSGVSVEGRFVHEDGSLEVQPAFFANTVQIINGHYHEFPQGKWSIRFSPQKPENIKSIFMRSIHLEQPHGLPETFSLYLRKKTAS